MKRPPETQTREYDLPTYWANYIVNGEVGDLTDKEVKEIDDWLQVNVPDWTLGDVSEETWFTRYPDHGGLPCDVSTYTFVLL